MKTRFFLSKITHNFNLSQKSNPTYTTNKLHIILISWILKKIDDIPCYDSIEDMTMLKIWLCM